MRGNNQYFACFVVDYCFNCDGTDAKICSCSPRTSTGILLYFHRNYLSADFRLFSKRLRGETYLWRVGGIPQKKSVTGEIEIIEFSDVEDAKEAYLCLFNRLVAN